MADGLKERLDRAVEKINVPEFIYDDPVQFPRRFESQRDIEIISLLSAIVAWGKRPQILKDCEKIIGLMDGEPYRFVMAGDWGNISDEINVHRTMFGRHLRYLLKGFREIYGRYSTMEEFSIAVGAPGSETPAWTFAEHLNAVMHQVNDGKGCPECLPGNFKTTPLKRINMALRWLVRDDGLVDMGLWKQWDKSKLYIPLDVHVGNVSRSLGLIDRKSNDRKTVELLTERLREFDSNDPCKYDFALFGLGVTGQI